MTNPMTSDSEDYGEWQIHAKSVCSGFCPFHNPSDHPLKDAPIHIRGDKMMLVERICEHGVGHDDPDSVAYFHSKGEMWAGIHGCDGCCGTKVSEDGSSTDDHANAEPSRELAQEAQSEASSVDTILRELVRQAELAGSGNIYASDSLSLYLSDAAGKINRLIDDAVIGFASELKESFRGKIIPYKNDGERQIVEQAYHDWTNAIDDALSNNLSKGGV